MAQVKVNLPGTDKGELVEVLHLGLFPNGATSDVTEEQLAHFNHETGNEYTTSSVIEVPTPTPTVAVPVDPEPAPVVVQAPSPVVEVPVEGGE